MAMLSETDTRYFGPEVLSVEPVEMTDEEPRVYKQKVSFESDFINKEYQKKLEKIKNLC